MTVVSSPNCILQQHTLTYKDAITVIQDVERHVPVDRVRYKGLHLWPLLRLKLGQNLMFSSQPLIQNKKSTSSVTLNYQSLKEKYESALAQYQALLDGLYRKMQKELPVSALFISHIPGEYEFIQNKFYNKFLDPLKELLIQKRISFTTLEAFSKAKEPKCFSTYKISELLKVAKKLAGITYQLQKVENGSANVCRHFSPEYAELDHYLQKLEVRNCVPSDTALQEECEIFLQTEELFNNVLTMLNPKLCFFICCFSKILIPCIRACRQLNIKTVDMQHGGQHDYHLFYTNWRRMPAEGYDTIPHYFWCWGERSRDRFTKWTDHAKGRHIPIVGGNLWLSKYCDNQVGQDNREGDYITNLSGKKVLITLQPSPPTDLFPTLLIDAINQSPPEIKWLIRMHPKWQQQQKENILKLHELINAHRWDAEKIDVEHTSNMPLFSLLEKVDYHVTQVSTIAYEAEVFGVPTIIVGRLGQENFTHDIEQGFLFYATTAADLLTIITNEQKPVQRPSPYVELDTRKAINCIDMLMQSVD